MKKYLLFILIFFSSLDLIGQKRIFEPHLKIGGSYGFTFSRVDFQPYKKQEFINGQTLNFEIFYSSQKYVGIKLGYGEVKKGWEIINDSLGIYTRELKYYNIPFTTHIEVWQPRKFNLIIDIGPYIAFLKNEKELIESINFTEDFVGKNVDNKFEFGFIGSIGVQYNFKIHSFFISINYYNSLTNIFTPTEIFQYFSSRNQTLGVNFGYLLKLF